MNRQGRKAKEHQSGLSRAAKAGSGPAAGLAAAEEAAASAAAPGVDGGAVCAAPK